ncbi:MAG: MBL fold metallo-hydrolase [Methyloprofundus sp.]|nr:MBL fold metallo-hydrolase [Methyloprofundus sp.]
MLRQKLTISHHGAVSGVTGSCHELHLDTDNSVLIDCGLFQGAEISPNGSRFEQLSIDFPVSTIQALIVSHCHIDHVGRIPYLLAAGFKGPIYCSEPTAELLPLVLKDAIKIGFTKDKALVGKFLALIHTMIVAVPYRQWQLIPLKNTRNVLKIKLNPAGHILGSAYIECAYNKQRIVFSGDLGASYTPLLPAPKSPYKADILVLESTYGDKNHQQRRHRKSQLKQIIEKCFINKGVILIPAFSIGRTQELLYELEDIIHHSKQAQRVKTENWDDLEIIIDSPLASEFTEVYKKLRPYWDKEAKNKVMAGRHPLSFEQLTTINSHQDHINTVAYLKKTARPCIVIAASGMCSGGRIVNYLKALIEDKRTDILFVGYQATATPGWVIQKYADRQGYVELDGQRYNINAAAYTLSGYSAHADQAGLLRFIKGLRKKPKEIRLVHGDNAAKLQLKQAIEDLLPDSVVLIPDS